MLVLVTILNNAVPALADRLKARRKA